MSRVSRQRVERCKAHRAIKERVIETLEETDSFSLSEIVEATGFGLFADAIHWQHLRDIITDETGRELIPVAAAYFTFHDVSEEHRNPGKFVAGGGERLTAGYVQYSPRTQHLAEYNLSRKRNMIEGSARRYTVGCRQMQTYVGDLNPRHRLPLFERLDDDAAA